MSMSAGSIGVNLEAYGGAKFSAVIADAAKALKNVGQGADDASKIMKKLNDSISSTVKSALVATASWAALKGAFTLAHEAQSADKAIAVFKSLGGSMESLREATMGMISDADLAKRANLAQTMGINEKDFEGLARVAKAAAAKTGQSVDFMFDSIITGSARMSKPILDNLGIMINVDKVYADYAKTLGTTAEGLSDVEKRQAFVNDVLNQGGKMLEELAAAGTSFVDPYEQAHVAVQNLANDVGRTLRPMFEGLLPAVMDVVHAIKEMVSSLSDTNWKGIGQTIGAGLKHITAILIDLSAAVTGVTFGVKLLMTDRSDASRKELDALVATLKRLQETKDNLYGEGVVKANMSLDEADVMGADVSYHDVPKKPPRDTTEARIKAARKSQAADRDLEKAVDDYFKDIAETNKKLNNAWEDIGDALDDYFAAVKKEQERIRENTFLFQRAMDKNAMDVEQGLQGQVMAFTQGGLSSVNWSEVFVSMFSTGGQRFLRDALMTFFDPETATSIMKPLRNFFSGIDLSEEQVKKISGLIGQVGSVVGKFGGFIGDALGGVVSAFEAGAQAVKQAFDVVAGRMAGDVFKESRLQGAGKAGMGAAAAVFAAAVATKADIFLAPIAVAVAAAIGVGLAAWDLSTQTQSFKHFQDAMSGAMDLMVKQLEPFWRMMLPLAGVFGATAEAVGNFLMMILPGPVIISVVFNAFKVLALGTLAIVWQFQNLHVALLDLMISLATTREAREKLRDEKADVLRDRTTTEDSIRTVWNLDIPSATELANSLANQHKESTASDYQVPSGYKTGRAAWDAMDPTGAAVDQGQTEEERQTSVLERMEELLQRIADSERPMGDSNRAATVSQSQAMMAATGTRLATSSRYGR